MSMLDRFRRWIWRVEERSNELEYSVIDEVHRAEDRLDSATGGRFYDAVEEADEKAEHLLEELHLDDEEMAPDGDASPADKPRAGGETS
jgi:hypothetical protein